VLDDRTSVTSDRVSLDPHARTLPVLLSRAAERYAGRACLAAGDVRLSYADVCDVAARYAGALAAAGVERGDRVAVLSENRFEVLALWLGCAWSGAIFVPVNTGIRGDQLAHVLASAEPRVLAVEDGLASRLEQVERPATLERVWAIGGAPQTILGLETQPFPAPGEPAPPVHLAPGDTLAILFTSGTTGPSKGVECPHAQFTWWGENVGSWLGLTSEDTLYTCLPLFHTNALNAFVQAIVHGAHFVLGPRFSASRFWQRATEAEATVTYLLGTMVSILLARDPSPLDRAHRVRVALSPATPASAWEAFEERFGVRIVDGHGMTETNAVIGPRDGEQRPGFMGRVMPGFQAKVVDEHDVEVPDGTPGELVMRPDHPFAFATGYWRMPEETVEAWRNLWFHSGDRVVRDEDGFFRFLDRLKDSIRRRGENVSAWEVEQALQRHPSVEAAAAIPVPSELGEDDVMAIVVLRPGATFEPVELIRHCERHLAPFAVPRYLEAVEELPLTANGKVSKPALRERGVTATTWDREAAGVKLGG
jgi:crotonobetaine/carnitine-CoA ligase